MPGHFQLSLDHLVATCREAHDLGVSMARAIKTGDMKEQGRKLMAMLNTAVNSLDNIEALIGPLKHSGKAHAGYGVKAEDYDKVGASFLWTLEKGLGDAFTPDVKEAWTVVYTTVAGVMIEGAEYPANVEETAAS